MVKIVTEKQALLESLQCLLTGNEGAGTRFICSPTDWKMRAVILSSIRKAGYIYKPHIKELPLFKEAGAIKMYQYSGECKDETMGVTCFHTVYKGFDTFCFVFVKLA
jgi:hypothetical protein